MGVVRLTVVKMPCAVRMLLVACLLSAVSADLCVEWATNESCEAADPALPQVIPAKAEGGDEADAECVGDGSQPTGRAACAVEECCQERQEATAEEPAAAGEEEHSAEEHVLTPPSPCPEDPPQGSECWKQQQASRPEWLGYLVTGFLMFMFGLMVCTVGPTILGHVYEQWSQGVFVSEWHPCYDCLKGLNRQEPSHVQLEI